MTPLARADLAELSKSSRRMRGALKTEQYFERIVERMHRLRTRPLASRPRGDIHAALRSVRVGRHLFFFVFDDLEVVLVRVLHERMDAPSAVIRSLRDLEGR